MKSVVDKTVWDTWRQFEKDEGAEGFFQELLEKVLTSAPKMMDDLDKALKENNVKVVHYCAHTLSSSCRALGATGLAAQLKEMENATRSQPAVVRSDLGAPIRSAFNQFIEEVQAEYDALKKAASSSLPRAM